MRALFVALALFGATAVCAEPVSLPNTEVRHLHSKLNGVDYRLYVARVTAELDTPLPAQVPVIYMLDADYSFAIVRNVVEHLVQRNNLPPMLLVAIGYDGPLRYREHRTRDYTPTANAAGGYGPPYDRYAGGGPKFLQFIRTELIPWVEQQYPAGPRRSFIGHSYGGLFGAWTLLTAPQTFDDYILISPSLWYDEHLPIQLIETYAKAHARLPARVYLDVGSREINSQRSMPDDLRAFADALRSHDFDGLWLRAQVSDDETHNSIFPGAVTRGLRAVYSN